MIIEKGKKIYNVKELSKKWTVSAEIGKLVVSYDIPKDICTTVEELREYVLKSNLF